MREHFLDVHHAHRPINISDLDYRLLPDARRVLRYYIQNVKEVDDYMYFEAETLLTLLAIAAVLTVVVRIVGGFTLAGLLTTFLLASLGAVGAWQAQRYLGLPVLYTLPFPGDRNNVPVVWPTLGALVGALLGSRLWRPRRGRQRERRRSR